MKGLDRNSKGILLPYSKGVGLRVMENQMEKKG